jgi:hypothetical protein
MSSSAVAGGPIILPAGTAAPLLVPGVIMPALAPNGAFIMAPGPFAGRPMPLGPAAAAMRPPSGGGRPAFGQNAPPPGFAGGGGGHGGPPPMPSVTEKGWLYADDEGNVHGPHSVAEFKAWVASMSSMPEARAQFLGMLTWVRGRPQAQTALRMGVLLGLE